MGHVIMFWNQKGGVGKTTNTVNIAAGLGERGKTVLVVDTDAECGCTRGLGCPDDQVGAFEWMSTGLPLEEVIYTHRMPPGVHLVPSRPDMAHIERAVDWSDPASVYQAFESQVAAVGDRYDYILFDTPPGPGARVVHAVAAVSDFVVLAVKADAFSFDALCKAVERTIIPMQERLSLKLDILGVLISDNDSRSNNWLTDIVNPMVENGSEHLLFRHRVRHHKLITECQRNGISIFQAKDRNWKSNATVVEDYRGVVRELMHRIDHFDDFVDGKLSDMPLGYPEEQTIQKGGE